MTTPIYMLIAENASGVAGNIVLYQYLPSAAPPVYQSLAWNVLPFPATPTTPVPVTLSTDWSFFWTSTPAPPLVPGVVVAPPPAAQTLPATLPTANQTTFTMATGSYAFLPASPGPVEDGLTLIEDSTVPLQQAIVGFALVATPATGQPAPAAVFATAAEPNLTLSLTPAMSFWILFDGTQDIVQGQVLQPGSATFAAPVTFPDGVNVMYATFNGSSWTVSQVPS